MRNVEGESPLFFAIKLKFMAGCYSEAGAEKHMRDDSVGMNWRKWPVPDGKSNKKTIIGQLYWKLQHDEQSQSMQRQIDQQEAPEKPLIVNRYAEHWNDETMRDRLQLWGIPVSNHAVWKRRAVHSSNQRYVRTITYWVYGHDIVHAGICSYSSAHHQLVQPIKDWNRAPYRRLARIAIKAAYALGYDTLQVTLQAGGEQAGNMDLPAGVLEEPQLGDAVVHAAPVSEGMGQEVWAMYRERLKQHAMNYYQATGTTNNVLYGMDCEFLLYDSVREKALMASHFLPLAGVAGCDAVRRNGLVIYPLMELRPLPAKTPKQLIEHLREAMREAKTYLRSSSYRNRVSWLGGAYPYGRLPIGCHLHLSGVPYDSELIRTFDTYAALPLALLEPKQESKRRRPTYGMFGDVRMQDHGGAGGYEYRTLPNFVHTPELAFDIVTLMAALTEYYRKLHRRESTQAAWITSYLNPSDYTGYHSLAVELLQEVKKQVVHTEQKSAILRLIERIDRGWRWDEREDIAQCWLT